MQYYKIIGALVAIVFFVSADTQLTYAQSGARSIGGSGARSVGGGGAVRSSGSRSFGGSSRRSTGPSAAERARLQQQQLKLERELAIENAEATAELSRQQYKQTLIQLGDDPNGNANTQQYRLAFDEAKSEFKALINKRVSPNSTDNLKQPFRLPKKDLNRKSGKLNWPSIFKSEDFSEVTDELDSQITEGGLSTSEEAEEFLTKLMEVNSQLGEAAVAGDIKSTNYARAKRFITGLANEVKASDLVL